VLLMERSAFDDSQLSQHPFQPVSPISGSSEANRISREANRDGLAPAIGKKIANQLKAGSRLGQSRGCTSRFPSSRTRHHIHRIQGRKSLSHWGAMMSQLVVP